MRRNIEVSITYTTLSTNVSPASIIYGYSIRRSTSVESDQYHKRSHALSVARQLHLFVLYTLCWRELITSCKGTLCEPLWNVIHAEIGISVVSWSVYWYPLAYEEESGDRKAGGVTVRNYTLNYYETIYRADLGSVAPTIGLVTLTFQIDINWSET